MEQLKKLVIVLGENMNKVGLVTIIVIVAMMAATALAGEKLWFFDYVVYPPMVVYSITPYLYDKVKGNDATQSTRGMLIKLLVVYALSVSF